ncbi:serine hydrolase domain-containing protein [Amycolatopsis sp. PS_44_ISF1]|uniref:serine hydrolase domain-containing protein n=1 Tax=Amycolatopsis sp. PS_44_ISF1 TaxID=2974917 RepID=UPI0028DF594F|nr:serine hydrolase domain-containing protein [Amycolatopsis sp. PS_44_ISF1]MDT8913512.1 beta-lactamase family protein [Amycolatopsis sp. PS_44_ISF1]
MTVTDPSTRAAVLDDAWLATATEGFRRLGSGAADPVKVLLELTDPAPGAPARVLMAMDLDTGRLAFSRAGEQDRAALTVVLTREDAVTLLLGDGRARVRLFETGRVRMHGVFLFVFFLDRLLTQDPSGTVARLRAAAGVVADPGAGLPAHEPLPAGAPEQAAGLPRTVELLRAETRRTSPGVQLYVSHRGTPVFDAGLGSARPGVPMRADARPIWYCCAKTVSAVAVGRLWEQELLDPYAPVADVLPWYSGDGRERVRLVDILTHTSPVPMGADPLHGCMSAPWDLRRGAVARMPVPDGPNGVRINYAAWWGWFVIAELIEALTGRDHVEYLETEVLGPCGMDRTKVVFDAAGYEADGATLPLIYVAGGALPPQPTWWFSTEGATTTVIPGLNIRGPMRDLGRLFEMLVRQGQGRSGRVLRPVTVAALTGRHRVGLEPDQLGNADWSLGFRLESRHLGERCCAFGRSASLRSFGHYGLWTTVVFTDPDHDLVVALHLNGKTMQDEHQRRVLGICDAIYTDLGLSRG